MYKLCMVGVLLITACMVGRAQEGEGISIKEVEILARQGDPYAQYKLAVAHFYGINIHQNYRLAWHWFEKSASKDHSAAQFNLGIMYEHGIGVLRNDKKAVYWYKKAAQQRHKKAQYNLGVMYEKGAGVARNIEKARQWYEKAQSNGISSHVSRIDTAGLQIASRHIETEVNARAISYKEKIPRHAINIYPIGLFLAKLTINYELMLDDNFGLCLQGGIFGGDNFGLTAAWNLRYHYFTNESQRGLDSWFVGPFAYYENSFTVRRFDTGTYELNVVFSRVGVNWGRRWVGNPLNILWRIGLGVPLITEYSWWSYSGDALDENTKRITKIMMAVDGELSIGFAF